MGAVIRWTWLISPSFVLEVCFFVVFVRGMPHGRCDSMDVVDSFVLEVYLFVVLIRGMPYGRCGSMDMVDFSFLRAGGVFLRGVCSWNAPWAL